MQHVSTYNSHLQAKLRTVNALQSDCAHLGSHMAYSVFAMFFFSVHKVTYIWDRGSTVTKVLCYKSEGRWFYPS